MSYQSASPIVATAQRCQLLRRIGVASTNGSHRDEGRPLSRLPLQQWERDNARILCVVARQYDRVAADDVGMAVLDVRLFAGMMYMPGSVDYCTGGDHTGWRGETAVAKQSVVTTASFWAETTCGVLWAPGILAVLISVSVTRCLS